MDGMGPFSRWSRRKVSRVERADAEAQLNELLALRSAGEGPMPRRERLVSFREVIEEWLDAGCPSAAPGSRTRHAKTKSPNTISNAQMLLRTHVTPAIGALWVERTRTERIEKLFGAMADAGYATSTIDRTWGYLNQACQYAQRRRRIKSNPAQDVLLPQVKAPKARKSLTVEQVSRIVFVALPQDPHPAMWLTGLMCGLRPGESQQRRVGRPGGDEVPRARRASWCVDLRACRWTWDRFCQWECHLHPHGQRGTAGVALAGAVAGQVGEQPNRCSFEAVLARRRGPRR